MDLLDITHANLKTGSQVADILLPVPLNGH